MITPFRDFQPLIQPRAEELLKVKAERPPEGVVHQRYRLCLSESSLPVLVRVVALTNGSDTLATKEILKRGDHLDALPLSELGLALHELLHASRMNRQLKPAFSKVCSALVAKSKLASPEEVADLICSSLAEEIGDDFEWPEEIIMGREDKEQILTQLEQQATGESKTAVIAFVDRMRTKIKK